MPTPYTATLAQGYHTPTHTHTPAYKHAIWGSNLSEAIGPIMAAPRQLTPPSNGFPDHRLAKTPAGLMITDCLFTRLKRSKLWISTKRSSEGSGLYFLFVSLAEELFVHLFADLLTLFFSMLMFSLCTFQVTFQAVCSVCKSNVTFDASISNGDEWGGAVMEQFSCLQRLDFK